MNNDDDDDDDDYDDDDDHDDDDDDDDDDDVDTLISTTLFPLPRRCLSNLGHPKKWIPHSHHSLWPVT